MINPKDANSKNALECYGRLLDAIPKGKKAPLLYEMFVVEATMNQAFRLLNGIRQYCLDTPKIGGEESPFVKQIDALVERPSPKSAEDKPSV